MPVAGSISLFAVQAKFRPGFDDSLDVVGVHFVGGVVGMLGVGLAAPSGVNAAVTHVGLLYGCGLWLVGPQVVVILAAQAGSLGVRGGIAVLVPVTVLHDDGTTAAIDGKLKVGDKVVIDGQLRVIPGKPVQISQPAKKPA